MQASTVVSFAFEVCCEETLCTVLPATTLRATQLETTTLTIAQLKMLLLLLAPSLKQTGVEGSPTTIYTATHISPAFTKRRAALRRKLVHSERTRATVRVVRAEKHPHSTIMIL